ncbi:bacteriochlorophyll 4-vinyl reductase [uncultured Roseobacter sp.]|uniref:bacteriochlorophyll 4-vinyl reductase n=1 Tax=uncultured Roseobacter sp. TaxID=114847 RepID=UPI0026371CDD|nr:bacteriochlorophyll 4-vinyl reductase [uncultured Roseobacter sp.]
MPDTATEHRGLIGPNAVLQLLPHLESLGGRQNMKATLERAGILEIPDGRHMIPEKDAARLHQLLRAEEPTVATSLTTAAGRDTADYILRHRIPKPAQYVLRALPARPAARLLSRAIAKHAWTFAGSGAFSASDPWTFYIKDNPVIRGEVSHTPLCAWHAAVFERLYRRLVHPHCRCTEIRCCAQRNSDLCEFRMSMESTISDT